MKQEIEADWSICRDGSCRGSSIKTRIETVFVYIASIKLVFVAEVVPLKQGLKQIPLADDNPGIKVAEVVPLKQGLKPTTLLTDLLYCLRVAEVVPLKQGLKPLCKFALALTII